MLPKERRKTIVIKAKAEKGQRSSSLRIIIVGRIIHDYIGRMRKCDCSNKYVCPLLPPPLTINKALWVIFPLLC